MKKNFRITIIMLLIILLTVLSINVGKDNKIYANNNKISTNTNTISMMYETEANSGEYQVSSDKTWPQEGYTFNKILSSCENGSKLTWNEESKKILLEANKSDKCYVYFDKEPDVIYLSDYIINNVYVEDGINNLYYHDGSGSYTNANQEAGDNSYRYSGGTENVNNYVCFGTDEKNCSEDNLYRIIGVFDDKIKLIKNNSIGNYYWIGDEGAVNSALIMSKKEVRNSIFLNGILAAPNPSTGDEIYWNQARLNKFLNNSLFLNTLDIKWQSMIYTTIWRCNSIWPIDINVKEFYLKESDDSITNDAKIGLMYVSDYGYANIPDGWNNSMSSFNTTSINNWLYTNEDEWTLTGTESNVLFISPTRLSNDIGNLLKKVRPVFYLNPDVQYISGDGTQTNPFRIA